MDRPSGPGIGSLRAAVSGGPPSAALELFYDLVFVAAIVVLSNSYSHSPTLLDLAWLAAVFAVIWLIWLQTSLLFDLSDAASNVIRFLVLAQMLLLMLSASSASDGVLEHTEFVGPLFAAILVVLALMHRLGSRRDASLERFARTRIMGCMAAAVLFALTPLYPDPGYLVPWLAGIVCLIAPSLRPDPLGGSVLDREHLVERFGAFTIIVLGESFVKTGLTTTEVQMEGLDLICLVGSFLIVFAIWWLYFSDVPSSGPPTGHRGHAAWMLMHLPLHLCIVGIAVGTAKVISAEGPTLEPEVVPFLTVPLIGVLVCLAAIESLSGDDGAGPVTLLHLGSAALVALVGLIGRYLDPAGLEGTSLALAAIMIATVVLAGRVRRGVDRGIAV